MLTLFSIPLTGNALSLNIVDILLRLLCAKPWGWL